MLKGVRAFFKELLVETVATRRSWQMLLLIIDLSAVVFSTVIAYLLRFDFTIPPEFSRYLPAYLVISGILFCTSFALFGLYRVVLRYVGLDTLFRVFGAVSAAAALITTSDLILSSYLEGMRPIPFGIIFTQTALIFIAVSGIRIAVRAAQHLRIRSRHIGDRVLIVGAGSAGSLLLREFNARPGLELDVVGFVDDDPDLIGRIIHGTPVLAATSDLEAVIRNENIQQVYVALPSVDVEFVREILNRLALLGVTVRIMPKIVIERGQVSLSDMRKVDVNDLLGRPLTYIDTEQISITLKDKVVAVTGAAGSIGSELCRQILASEPSKLLLLEIDESRLYELMFELEALRPGVAEMHILDVRNEEKVARLFAELKPQVVLHAAAYKHVPLMELEPSEAFIANVKGTSLVMDAAGTQGVERFVLISTDKAVAPINVMGKTKQIAERLMLSFAEKYPETMFCAVRFGNVLGSRGSVVPIFEAKLARGENLSVTHPEATRYFMVIPEAARLVLQAQAIGKSGDIFVLEMGEPVKIVHLAQKLITLSGVPVDIEFSGLRAGEKLHEVLISEDEELVDTSAKMIKRIKSHKLSALSLESLSAELEKASQGDLEAEEILAL